MQKGKAAASPPAMVLSRGPPQQNARGPPSSQPRPEDFNQRQQQTFPIGQMQQNVVMAPMPNQMPGPPGQQSRMPSQPFYHPPRGIRIPRHQTPNNPPIYSSPPTGFVQLVNPQGGHPPFIPPGQGPPQYIPPHVQVDYGQIPGPHHMQYRPQQPIPGPFPPVSGPSQGPSPFGYPSQQTGYPVGQPQGPLKVFWAPAAPINTMQQYSPNPNFEPRTPRERKLIVIKDPNSNKDVTQEVLSRQPSGSVSGSASASTGGTPSNTPDLSGQSSSSNTPPLTSQQQDLRAQFAAQVAATLIHDTDKNRKPGDIIIQKPLVNNKATTDAPKLKDVADTSKDDFSKQTEISPNITATTETKLAEQPVEKNLVTQLKEEESKSRQHKEAAQGSKLGEGISVDTPLVSSVNAITATKGIISNVRVEIYTPEDLRNKEIQQSNASTSEVKPAVEPEEEVVKTPEVATEEEGKALNGPVVHSSEEVEETEETEEIITVDTNVEVEVPPVENVIEPAVDSNAADQDSQPAPKAEPTLEDSAEEVIPIAPESEGMEVEERANGHEAEAKTASVAKNSADVQGAVKDMKKKKQNKRLKDMEKRFSAKEVDLMDAYTEKPVKEEVPEDAEEPEAEESKEEEEAAEEVPSEEETWEDKEESSFPDLDGEPERQDGGKLTYERDFLLKFQTNPMCMLKPEGLPDLEVVLGQPRTPSKSGYPNRMQPKDGGENMFLPAYLRQNSRGNPSNSRTGRRNVQPKKVIDLAPKMTSTDQLKKTEKRWIRPSEVAKEGLSEEQIKTEEILRKVRSILNKLTPQKFQTLTKQIMDLEIDTPERLESAIDLIFEKAIDEPAFSVAYANMCRCLIPKKVAVEKDGSKKDVTFRTILLNKCQREFEKEKSVEKRIHEKLEELTSKGLSEEELEMKKKDLQDEETLVKRRTLGNIRFIGELFKLKMLTESIMHDCVVKLLKSNDEEAFECLCKLLVTIGKDLDHIKAKPRVDQYFAQILKIIQARITSARVRFMMQDIVDLRGNNWVPRREDNNPKTIDQIHKEAADAAKKTQLMIQMAKQDKKLRGNMGGRDSPRPSGGVPQADETWTTVGRGPKNVSVDPKRFQNIKRPVDSENISLGPGGRGFSSWARGSSGGTGAVGAGAGPTAASAAPPATSADDSRTTAGNRYSALAGERKYSAPARQNSGGSGRQEPRSPMGGGRRAPFGAGEREKALEAVRAVTQPKRNNQEREGGRESPRLTPEASSTPEAPSTPEPTSASVSPAPELTPEEMKRKANAIIEEYLAIKDMKEAVECVKELESPATHYVFVTSAFNHTVEKSEASRKAIGRLFHFLFRDGVLTNEQYLAGVEPIMECAEDLEVDIPLLWKYLAEIMGPTAFDGNLNLDKLFLDCVLKHVSKRKGAKLFAHLLEIAANDTSREDVSAILSRFTVKLNVFFDSDEEAVEFAKDKNIEFALSQVSSSQKVGSTTQHSAKIQEELRTLILKRKARNEEVFEWIDKYVPETETKEASFIRALVTVVCEDTMEREDGGLCKCNVNLMKDRKSLLQKYIDVNGQLELQALFAVQALFVQLDHPPGFIKSYFDTLYDEDVITEDSFHAWESSPEEQLGKGVAIGASSEFFRWLRSASEEPTEDS